MADQTKTWVSTFIDRYGDAAQVTVRRYWFCEGQLCSELLEQYETASRGATKSARKAKAKFEGSLK